MRLSRVHSQEVLPHLLVFHDTAEHSEHRGDLEEAQAHSIDEEERIRPAAELEVVIPQSSDDLPSRR
eukprot:15909238-Heterocapsa_arctica.AAC.1